MNTIDISVPTMWYDDQFISRLERYCNCKSINKIFIVDNLKSKRPQSEILNHEKIKIICYGTNIYVNPAWNEGYYRSEADVLCLLSDDVFVEEDIFDLVSQLDITEIDIIGAYLKGSIDNFHITHHSDGEEKLIKLDVNKNIPIGTQVYAFGVCMFVKRSSYKEIPSLYKIWFGDDYVVQNCENVYALKTSKIHGEISKTIVALDKNKKTSVQSRIDLDTKNAYNYGHFKNAKNWKFIQSNLNKTKNIFGY